MSTPASTVWRLRSTTTWRGRSWQKPQECLPKVRLWACTSARYVCFEVRCWTVLESFGVSVHCAPVSV
jgi:hypothetical protein